MNADKGGRRCDVIALSQTVNSPMHTVTSSVGSQPFEEPLPRHLAESHSMNDSRQERHECGYVHFRHEPNVPDVGGVGWRTRTGHLLKNQAYYSSAPKTNKWDLPTHAGINTWKEWHGPRIRSDAPMMERLDHYDEELDEWEAKKTHVNTTRAQTLDRFYNKKLNRDQLEASQSWAPHRRAKKEVHDCHDHFFADMDCKPEKELKKVLTAKVLQRDREAIRAISSRIQNEETWKQAWKHMEQERRLDIRHDFKQRQSYNDLLMHLSGQPVRERDESYESRFNSASVRTEELAAPRDAHHIKDVTALTDFRGLFHADNEHALEALFPGDGHELSVEFRKRATDSTTAGFPPPPKAQTPRMQGKKGAREIALQKECTLTTERVPISIDRLDKVATRTHDDTLANYSKAQFLKTTAPPPPNQGKTLLKDDFSPKSTLHDSFRVTGSFQRTEQGTLPHGPFHPESPKHKRKGVEHLPPAQRSYTYPVLAPSSPNARGAQASQASVQASEVSSPKTPFQGSLQASLSQPNLGRTNSSAASFASRKRRPQSVAETSSSAVCRELDSFESSMTSMPTVSNFFGTPRSHRRAAQGRSATDQGLSRSGTEVKGLGRSVSDSSMPHPI